MNAEEIQAIFFAECEESLAAAEQGLAACKEGTQDADTVNAVFRGVHSIKGGAGAFGFIALQAYTHTFETLLSDVRDGTVAITEPLIDLLLRALDTLSDHVMAARGQGDTPDDAALQAEMTAAMAANAGAAPAAAHEPAPAPEAAPAPASSSSDDAAFDDMGLDFDSMLDSIAGAMAASDKVENATEGEDAPGGWIVKIRPHAGAMRNGSEPMLMLREVLELGGTCVDCEVGAVPHLDVLDPGMGYLGWTFRMPGSVDEASVRDIFDFVGDDCEIAIGSEAVMPAVRLPAAPPPAVPAAAAPPPVSVPAPAPAPQPAAAQPAPPAAADPAATPSAPPAPVAPPAAPAAVAAAATPPAPPAPGQSIRIELSKLDKLIDAVGELVIAQAMMAQRLSSEGLAASEEIAVLDGLTRDIQESAMAIRAQPIGSVFSRVPRIMRELSASTGKHVRLEVSGESTELDKTVIERLGEPLTHLIRNAVDHGIEKPEERLAAGKSAEGTLTLSAEHRSGRILIRIGDDGRGINRDRVLAKAIEKGLVAPDAQLSKEEIDLLIFAPGFSTAQTVSNISGRGVGMDVVRQNVKDLGGRITIESEQGVGTTFTLTLPLTLAISDGMVVNVGDQTLVVPLANVVESLRPAVEDVKGLGSNRAMMNVRGRFIPVVPLHVAVGAYGAVEAPQDGVLIVVETEGAGRAALLVDSIVDQRQVVIKSLDTHYRSVEGVAGATILGDGRVALIVDVDGLVARSMAEHGQMDLSHPQGLAEAA
ncbi:MULTISPECIES: chemotaxis protein CheA [unclassified Novosphingobium]|uniref:chemotaxis protein CheA n=1 Tax=unclassified Novosphingobium TaxID=2644732 RepID=UPI0014943AC0|nr:MULTISPECIES: chemotaxis protein CheA [unclassified Novosphingobium]MBB3359425.1 two-component system chemotaxis sensor kinase CheA [Novosphingobium sp. BK256]MBB3375785.1 two-component system chemotaxis sensor kinase CheA [Novosphingobium sp. BK280]MBB3380198.1 two-component system chemotaxis sensor kinase CheA [Novosphingobium sp. BK258]MBB3421892.1 two-component system chemotaxis sensor kinase CheA [Novosphingobium sp. BK267]MBB3450548.1 two-component system chemotaxis sensor kinase CheA